MTIWPSPWAAAVVLASLSLHHAVERIPVAVVSRVFIACGARRAEGFDLRSAVHSLLATGGAVAVLMHESTLSIQEPERSFSCMPPSSSFSWALPYMELGYALHDLIAALRIGRASFVLHGLGISLILVILSALGVAHHTARVQLMHGSTFFLHLRRLDLGQAGNKAVDISFALSFLLLRWVVLPQWWVRFIWYGFTAPASGWGACMGMHIVWLAVVSGAALHALNAYWGLLILKRAFGTRRDETGDEKASAAAVTTSAWRSSDGLGTGEDEGHYRAKQT
eukprot:2690880-Pleurochrysis_carterae.AAC.1